MPRLLAPAVVAAMLSIPLPAFAQPLQSFLSLPLQKGHDLVVVDQAGTSVRGRLTALAAAEIEVDTGHGARRFAPADVRQLSVRKRHRLWGTLGGAAIGGVLGATVDCGPPPEPPCDVDLPILLGAGAGFVVGSLWHSTVVLYSAPSATAPMPGPPLAAAPATLQAPRLPW